MAWSTGLYCCEVSYVTQDDSEMEFPWFFPQKFLKQIHAQLPNAAPDFFYLRFFWWHKVALPLSPPKGLKRWRAMALPSINFHCNDFVARKDNFFHFDMSGGSKTAVWVIVWGSFTTLDFRHCSNPIRTFFPSAWITWPIRKAPSDL